MKRILTSFIDKLSGDTSQLTGDYSNLTGNCSGLSGDLDAAEITDEERAAGVDIRSLIAEAGEKS